MFEKYFVRRFETKCFTRSIVESSFDSLQVDRSDLREICLLGQILTYQAVGVFIEPAFPTGIGMSEINSGVQACRNSLVFTKLFAVVQRDRKNLVSHRC